MLHNVKCKNANYTILLFLNMKKSKIKLLLNLNQYEIIYNQINYKDRYRRDRLITHPYTTHLTVLTQLRQADITDSVYSVVVLILWLVRHITVTVFPPLVAP